MGIINEEDSDDKISIDDYGDEANEDNLQSSHEASDLRNLVNKMNFQKIVEKNTMTSLNDLEKNIFTKYTLDNENRTFKPETILPHSVTDNLDGKFKISIQSVGSGKNNHQISEGLKRLIHPNESFDDIDLYIAGNILRVLNAISQLSCSDGTLSLITQFPARIPFNPKSMESTGGGDASPTRKFKHSRSMGVLDAGYLNAAVVDDNEYNRSINRQFLERYGVKVIGEFKDGSEILDYYREHYRKIDFITMDIEMLKMDGKTATKEIRMFEDKHNLKPVKIAMVTGTVN